MGEGSSDGEDMEMGVKAFLVVFGICFFLFSIFISREVVKYERSRIKKCSDYCLDFTGNSSSFMTTNYCCCDSDSPLKNGMFDSKYCIPIEILMNKGG